MVGELLPLGVSGDGDRDWDRDRDRDQDWDGKGSEMNLGTLPGHIPNSMGWLQSLHFWIRASEVLIFTVCLGLGSGLGKL